MSALENDYLTVNEAATLLRVAPSTVRRWIREGDVPAFRLGKRLVALRRTDLSALITPLRPEQLDGNDVIDGYPIEAEVLTHEEEHRQAAETAAIEKSIREHAKNRENLVERKLTDEEVRRGLEALDELKKMRETDRVRRGGRPFPPSWITINEMRDERSRQLSGE